MGSLPIICSQTLPSALTTGILSGPISLSPSITTTFSFICIRDRPIYRNDGHITRPIAIPMILRIQRSEGSLIPGWAQGTGIGIRRICKGVVTETLVSSLIRRQSDSYNVQRPYILPPNMLSIDLKAFNDPLVWLITRAVFLNLFLIATSVDLKNSSF